MSQYLAALPADRRAALSAVRKAINETLPDGYEEGMQFGMIGWYVPLSVYPAGYGENPKVHSAFQLSAFSVSAFQRFRRAHGQLPAGEGAHRQGKLRKDSRARQQRKEGRQEVRGEQGATKEVTLATGFSEKEGVARRPSARQPDELRHPEESPTFLASPNAHGAAVASICVESED